MLSSVSVVPHLNAALARAFQRHFSVEPEFLSYRWGLMELDVEEPSKVGTDRIADAIGGVPSLRRPGAHD
jgi:pantothenate kinase type III